jgi:ribonuclease VapC
VLVLDSFAVLAWLGGEEPASETVQSLLDQSAAGEIDLVMSRMNVGEVYYVVAKRHGHATAKSVDKQLYKMPVDFVSVTDELVAEAARIKADYPLAYADAFAAALALEHRAELVTGDPEFEELEDQMGLEVRWIDSGR